MHVRADHKWELAMIRKGVIRISLTAALWLAVGLAAASPARTGQKQGTRQGAKPAAPDNRNSVLPANVRR
ncbi:hypothetical protein RM96_23460 [Cupriavidus sp. IDO]|nr:hypothetical protein RM96_23460 [Cupriavidus sp. IDO]